MSKRVLILVEGQTEERFTAAVQELQPTGLVEREHRDVDRLHHPAQESQGLDQIGRAHV